MTRSRVALQLGLTLLPILLSLVITSILILAVGSDPRTPLNSKTSSTTIPCNTPASDWSSCSAIRNRVLPTNSAATINATNGTQSARRDTSKTTSSPRKPMPPDASGRRLSKVNRTRYAPAMPANAPHAMSALMALRSVGTPSSSAERAFLPVAFNCKPQRVPRSASTTTMTDAPAKTSASRLTGKSLEISGSRDATGKGAVACALPPSGGCQGPEMR